MQRSNGMLAMRQKQNTVCVQIKNENLKDMKLVVDFFKEEEEEDGFCLQILRAMNI